MRTAFFLLLALGCATACSRQQTANCESPARYSTASSTLPVQIPDDLTPPDETNALRLPPDAVAAAAPSEACLESPPLFSREVRLGRRTEAREEASQPADASVDPERSIDN